MSDLVVVNMRTRGEVIWTSLVETELSPGKLEGKRHFRGVFEVLKLLRDAGVFRNNVCELKESCELPTITQCVQQVVAAISTLKDFPELL